jgi:putative addiction module killer protein
MGRERGSQDAEARAANKRDPCDTVADTLHLVQAHMGCCRVDVRQTDEFSKWLGGLRDAKARQKVNVRLLRLGDGNPGDVAPVGEGVSELRIDYGPGYRVYIKVHEGAYVALFGGDKSTQTGDIKKAKELAAGLEEESKDGKN